MSLSTYEGRSLPSVFSDLPSRNEVQQARQRIGRLGMWVFILLGALVLALGASAYAFNALNEKDADLEIVRQANRELQPNVEAYNGITELRDDVSSERHRVLELLGGLRGARAQAAWEEAKRLGFDAQPDATPDVNEPSRAWPSIYMQSQAALRDELHQTQSVREGVRRWIALHPVPSSSTSPTDCPGGNPMNCPSQH